MIQENDKVKHATLGIGIVDSVKQDYAIVTFENEETRKCPFNELEVLQDIYSELKNANKSNPDEVIAKVQSSIIQTINNKWGVFSRSNIDLLPHQLWVCNQVLKEWPVRYLVADDVGLGKTIEAGLMIWSLIACKKAHRILILTPAPLTFQWQERLINMFDLTFDVFTTEQENSKVNYWKSHTHVIASFPTMAMDNEQRRKQILESDPWDLVIVDEAHHMNATERQGKTLQYQFFEQLEQAGRVISTILFTGTPHRGFDFGFFSLMKLVNPDVFDPRGDYTLQFSELSKYFIRNNKQNTVDMEGNKLFKPVHQHPKSFSYTDKESVFYEELSDFIEEGKAYALSKSGTIVNSIQLVLIALQKLASSSIAAVTAALETRKRNLLAIRDNKLKEVDVSYKVLYEALHSESDDLDEEESKLIKEFENIYKKDTFQLMEDEISNLVSLIDLGKQITHESRIDQIIKIVEKEYEKENVLFFTEYKRTQSLLMSELMKKWGPECVTFINGDEALPDVIMPDESKRDFSIKRTEAAEKFNNGKVRFLISTEAAGEGIDLQKNCHVLIHADIPWNPMRLHQRVGRINRYGQKCDVDVVTLRNPDTVESRIWTKLEMKIMSITKAFSAGMSDPDDMMMLVLGMQNNKFYDDIYSEGFSVAKKGNVSSWFDSKEMTFGGEQAVSLITNMVGNAAKFNLAGLPDVPKCDLKDLVSFFKRAISLQGKRLTNNDDRYSFITPMEWFNEYGVKPRYDNLIFRRKPNVGESSKNICGVGHIAFDKCLSFADTLPSATCCIKGKTSYFIYKALNQKNYSGDRINKDLILLSYDSSTKEVTEIKLDDGLKIINNLDRNETDNFISEVPSTVQSVAEKRLMSFKYDLPMLELIFVLSGEK
ncbi:MAG: DEAD/DEAH box helicase [Treponema sp.]|nr:DEAD/DEAH box helicase [Treponema sp.]